MMLVKARLSIDDFILEMMRVPQSELCLAQLRDWVNHLALSDELFDRHISFSGKGYQRRLICHTPWFDLLLLCWQPGQASTVHDHGESLNVTQVYQGVLTSRTFATLQTNAVSSLPPSLHPVNAPLVLVQEEQVQRHQVVSVDRQQIHQLANTSAENLVTLHIYARPLRYLQVYCPPSGQAERVLMPSNWLDECA
jgi:cysteine dioxygenase